MTKTLKEIKLSTGKLCPKCGCDSLSECYSKETVFHHKNYKCVALCGLSFALDRLKSGEIRISYNSENEVYLKKRFGFKEAND